MALTGYIFSNNSAHNVSYTLELTPNVRDCISYVCVKCYTDRNTKYNVIIQYTQLQTPLSINRKTWIYNSMYKHIKIFWLLFFLCYCVISMRLIYEHLSWCLVLWTRAFICFRMCFHFTVVISFCIFSFY